MTRADLRRSASSSWRRIGWSNTATVAASKRSTSSRSCPGPTTGGRRGRSSTSSNPPCGFLWCRRARDRHAGAGHGAHDSQLAPGQSVERSLHCARRQCRPVRLGGSRAGRPAVGFRQGLVSNLGNPKMAVFFPSLLPQFAHSFAALLSLGLVFAAMTLLWLSAYALVVARAGDLLRRPRIRRTIDAVVGVVLVVFGVRLASEAR